MYGYVPAWPWQTAGHRADGAARWPAETQAPRYTHSVPGSVLFSQFTGRIRRPCWALTAEPGTALFGVGVYSSLTVVGDWRKNSLKMVAIGLGYARLSSSTGMVRTPAVWR